MTDMLAKTAKDMGIYLSIGINEEDGDEFSSILYCINLFFEPVWKIYKRTSL